MATYGSYYVTEYGEIANRNGGILYCAADSLEGFSPEVRNRLAALCDIHDVAAREQLIREGFLYRERGE